MDPLFEYLMYLETCVPGGVTGTIELNCPHCETLLEVEVPEPDERQRYSCCVCCGEFEIDGSIPTLFW